MKTINKTILIKSAVFAGILSFLTGLFSCVSVPVKPEIQPCSRDIMGKGIKTAEQLYSFFVSREPDCDKEKVMLLADTYIEEASIENVNSDAAFIQMCHETGFLRYGNLVQPEWNNFCGLGAMDIDHPGEIFPDVQTGVRAHIQHLQAYGTTEDVPLNSPCVDPRYSWPHKVKNAKTVFELAGSWATDKEYGFKLDNLLSELEKF